LLDHCLHFFWNHFSSRCGLRRFCDDFFLGWSVGSLCGFVSAISSGTGAGGGSIPSQKLAAVLAELLIGSIWETAVWTLTGPGTLTSAGTAAETGSSGIVVDDGSSTACPEDFWLRF
jgi:hypothetical protein